MSAKIPVLGVALAATGLSHFAKPQIYDAMTKLAFPDDTRRHVYIDGGVETALGLALAVPRTRKAALAGLAGYLGYLGYNAIRSRR